MKFKFSLAVKLMSICIALAAIPLLVIGCLNLWQFHSFAQATLDRSSISLKKQSEDILDSGVMVDRERISGLISRAETDVHHLARSSWLKGYLASISGRSTAVTPATPTEMTGDDPSSGQQAAGMALEGLKEEIAAMHGACAVQAQGQTFPAYNQIRYIDEKGQEIVNLKDGKFTTDLKSKAAEAWFQKTLQLSPGSVYNSGVVIAANTGTPEMRLAAPVFVGGSARGVVVLNMNWDLAWKLIQNRVYGKTGYSYIVNEQGVLVSHPKYNLTQPMNLCDPKNEELAKIVKEQMITGQAGRGSYTFEGIHKIIAFLPLKVGDKFYSIAANTPLNEFMELTNDIKADADKSASRSTSILAVCTLLMVLLSGMAGFLCSRSITRPLKRLVEDLTEATDHVAAASTEVSTSSQHLAEGASEQAAAIEETSSSLEEMSSMTKQNSDNAAQANHLMRNVSDRVEKANSTMDDLTSSMHEIASASEETQKIIKTIDEIAFQTNLLALNAAVEAARAGEAGAGFAVVADEVRNLALRAADAAKNTANLIEGTVKKIQEGVTLVTTTNGAFSEVRSSSASVGELVGEIAVASSEQAQGISQINKAVAEMDKVVQQNAAGAEEAASASEEMSSQAMRMQSFVNDLQEIITGGKQQTGRFTAGKAHAAGVPKASRSDAPPLFHPAPRGNGDNGKRSPDSHRSRTLPPTRQISSLEERDLDDF